MSRTDEYEKTSGPAPLIRVVGQLIDRHPAGVTFAE